MPGRAALRIADRQHAVSREAPAQPGLWRDAARHREKEPERPSTTPEHAWPTSRRPWWPKNRGAGTRRAEQTAPGRSRLDRDEVPGEGPHAAATRRPTDSRRTSSGISNNEPVVARPPSAAYRFQKLVRRNKLAFTAATCGGARTGDWAWCSPGRCSFANAAEPVREGRAAASAGAQSAQKVARDRAGARGAGSCVADECSSTPPR